MFQTESNQIARREMRERILKKKNTNKKSVDHHRDHESRHQCLLIYTSNVRDGFFFTNRYSRGGLVRDPTVKWTSFKRGWTLP